jgi:hypothetical protein
MEGKILSYRDLEVSTLAGTDIHLCLNNNGTSKYLRQQEIS